jgi:D-lactate dehydrogenase
VLLEKLRAIAGARHVLTGETSTRRYRTGYRTGSGPVTAVVLPGSLVEQWRVLQACIAADHIVIVQAANTGLTGGSTPNGRYDRNVVVVNTSRIDRIRLLRGGEQAVCLAGATLYSLERALRPFGREPHSVIGSSCIGASVVGGVCNNSGGSLIRRGPAYTEYALFAQIAADGSLRLHNNLGIDLGNDPESILSALDEGRFGDTDVIDHDRAASCRDYDARVRDVSAASPSRFNADPEKLFEASGSAGRVMVFAVRLDTFASEADHATFYVGSNDPGELTRLRRRMLTEQHHLPVSAEYIHRGAFDVAAKYGRDVFLAIRWLGTDRLPLLYAAKNRVDAVGRWFGRTALSDRVMQGLTGLLPRHLPRRMREYRDRYEHHLIIKTAGNGIAEAISLLADMFPSNTGDMFECTAEEADKAFLHRFAVAGAAVRYRAVHPRSVEDIVALDVALRRNDEDWIETLPAEVSEGIIEKLYYGHFFCHVFHQDYVVRKGVDPIALEHRMWELLDARGAKYPAEHNVGHLYPADDALASHYRTLDPGNHLNPGIGQTSRNRQWR